MKRSRGRRASISLVAGALLLAGACSRAGKPKPIAGTSPPAPPAPTSATAPAPQRPAAPQAPAPPGRSSKAVTFGRIVFSVPGDWDIHVDGDTAFVGVLAGGPDDVMLRVQRNFAGSIDSLRPASCPREGDPPEPAASVETVESGLRPVGDKKAEYRLWRVTCPTSGVREHRAWLLPMSKIAIYEQVHDPRNVDVVTSAELQ